MKISMKLAHQYMVIFFNFQTTSNHLHPLQVENCDSNSRLVVDGDDNGKFRPERVKASFYIPENRLNCPTTKGFRMKIAMKLAHQYMVIFFNFQTTSNHLHPLQVENCDSNSRLVVDEDDNGKLRLERVKISHHLSFPSSITMVGILRQIRYMYAVVQSGFAEEQCSCIFPWSVSPECIPQEPCRIEYYNQLFCLRGHLGVCLRFKPHWMFQIYKYVIQRIDLLFISHTQSHVSVARCII